MSRSFDQSRTDQLYTDAMARFDASVQRLKDTRAPLVNDLINYAKESVLCMVDYQNACSLAYLQLKLALEEAAIQASIDAGAECSDHRDIYDDYNSKISQIHAVHATSIAQHSKNLTDIYVTHGIFLSPEDHAKITGYLKPAVLPIKERLDMKKLFSSRSVS